MFCDSSLTNFVLHTEWTTIDLPLGWWKYPTWNTLQILPDAMHTETEIYMDNLEIMGELMLANADQSTEEVEDEEDNSL